MTEQQMLHTLDVFHYLGIATVCVVVGACAWAFVAFLGDLWRAVFSEKQSGMTDATHTVGSGEQQMNIVGPGGKVQTVTMREVPMRPCDHLIVAYEKYIAILGEEIGELSALAAAHDWKSTRYEAGLMARMEIESVMKDIGQSDCVKK